MSGFRPPCGHLIHLIHLSTSAMAQNEPGIAVGVLFNIRKGTKNFPVGDTSELSRRKVGGESDLLTSCPFVNTCSQ